jgi:hypothetical protein
LAIYKILWGFLFTGSYYLVTVQHAPKDGLGDGNMGTEGRGYLAPEHVEGEGRMDFESP